MKETLLFIFAIILWFLFQIEIASKNPCSMFANEFKQQMCNSDIIER